MPYWLLFIKLYAILSALSMIQVVAVYDLQNQPSLSGFRLDPLASFVILVSAMD